MSIKYESRQSAINLRSIWPISAWHYEQTIRLTTLIGFDESVFWHLESAVYSVECD